MHKSSILAFSQVTSLGILLASSVQLVLAAEQSADPAAVHCTTIQSATERLACYDAVYDVNIPPAATTVIAPVTTKAATPPARIVPDETSFGKKIPRAQQEGESISSVIAELDRDGYNKLIFTLDNGQVWRQTENKRFRVTAGQTAEIRHGSLGSYKLYIKGESRWTRVRRAQ